MSSEKITLSTSAQNKFNDLTSDISGLGLSTGCFGTIAAVFCLIAHVSEAMSLWSLKVSLLINLTFWSILWLTYGRKWIKEYRAGKLIVLEENRHDHQRSVELQYRFKKISEMSSVDFPVTENYVGSKLKPYRVEHLISSSIRGSLNGGIITPMLAENSSMVFFKNDNGDTLRALVPAPTVVREFFVQMIEKNSVAEKDTYTRAVLDNFAVNDENFIRPLSSPKMIDKLDSLCDRPDTERPYVKVRGIQLQDGVVIASSLEIEGNNSLGETIFFPSGYFKAVMKELEPVLIKRELNPASMVQQIENVVDQQPKALPAFQSETPREFTNEDQYEKFISASFGT